MARPRRPDPPPLEADDVRIVSAGTALWGITGVILLVFFHDTVPAMWRWTCLAGFLLGLLGVAYCVRRRARLARRQPVTPG